MTAKSRTAGCWSYSAAEETAQAKLAARVDRLDADNSDLMGLDQIPPPGGTCLGLY